MSPKPEWEIKDRNWEKSGRFTCVAVLLRFRLAADLNYSFRVYLLNFLKEIWGGHGPFDLNVALPLGDMAALFNTKGDILLKFYWK